MLTMKFQVLGTLTALICCSSVSWSLEPWSRGNLTVNIIVKYPENVLEENDLFNAPFFLYGNGMCLSWEDGTELTHTRPDTWELTLTYTQSINGFGCNDTSLESSLIGVHGKLEYRVVLNNTIDMLGANCGSNLPISMSAPYYETSPEINCNPWFFRKEGTVLSEDITSNIDFIGTRNMAFYLPPSYLETPYKQYPYVHGIDLGNTLYSMMESFKDIADYAIVAAGTMREILVVGTDDYRSYPENLFINDRFDLLGPVNPTYEWVCKNGTTMDTGCGGCFELSSNTGYWEIIYYLKAGGCGELVPFGGQTDNYLDFVESEVSDVIADLSNNRILTDQLNRGIFGCSLGGLVSCYAGWTRPDVYGFAGCQSSSFWWPKNQTGQLQFDFENIHIHNHRNNRSKQKFFMDLSEGDTAPDEIAEIYRMDEAALNLANSMAELTDFTWDENLWLDLYMDHIHGINECIGRSWTLLSEFYTPIGGPRNPKDESALSEKHTLNTRRDNTINPLTLENPSQLSKEDFKKLLEYLRK